jgi:hypothetical protein
MVRDHILLEGAGTDFEQEKNKPKNSELSCVK